MAKTERELFSLFRLCSRYNDHFVIYVSMHTIETYREIQTLQVAGTLFWTKLHFEIVV